jgi:hypothetical protein
MTTSHTFVAKLFSLLTTACLASGCVGYRLGNEKPEALKNIHSLAISPFENHSYEPNLSVKPANLLAQRLQIDGTFELESPATADATLEGTIESIERLPVSSGAMNRGRDTLLTSEYLLSVRIAYLVRQKETGKTLRQGKVTGTTSFFIPGRDLRSADIPNYSRQALPIALEQAATKIVSALAEGW